MTLSATPATADSTLDPATLDLHTGVTGARMTSIGDDGDLLILGHHDDAAALALLAEWRRHYDGADLTEADLAVYDVERRYAAFSTHSDACEQQNCTCEEDDVCDGCRTPGHGTETEPAVAAAVCTDPDDCRCAYDYDHERTAEWPCGCECWCDEYAWWVIATKSGEPVTWVRWSPAKSRAASEAFREALRAERAAKDA